MRSKYEENVAAFLKSSGVHYDYEPYSFEYYRSVRAGSCGDCASTNVRKRAWYTPDFILADGSIIETKGKFTGANRTSMLEILDTSGHITRDNFRLLFMYDNKLSKKSDTRYSDWCRKNGIIYYVSYVGEVPANWTKQSKTKGKTP